MKYFLIALMLFNSLVSTVVSAQETYEVPVQKDEVEESKFKSDIEARLRRDIESYLGNNRFIIQVDALIERARTVVKEDAKPTQQRPQTNLPTAPKVSGNFQMPEINEGDLQGFEELPGLPVSELPLLKENQQKFRALQAQLKTLEQERKAIIDYADELKDVAQKQQASSNSSASGPTEKTISYRNIIKKLSITLVVDTQLKDEQIEFLRNLITRKAQINELRGDTLSIVKTGFSHLKEDKTPLTFWDEYSPWIWLLSLLFICLFVVIAFLALWRRLSQPIASPSMAAQVGSEGANPKSNYSDSDKAALKYRINESRQRLVSQGLSQPHRFQQAVSHALSSAQAFEVASLTATMGKSLFSSLAPHLTPVDWKQIDDLLKDSEWDEAQLYEGMEQFSQRLEKQQDDASNSQPFAFLNKLNDSQVLYLIKDEDTRIKALVMSQLPAQRSADIILRLDERELANIAFELGQFESLPVSAFKDVADRLARASLTVPSFENITADGLSVLIGMLDKMTTSEETRMLKTLKSEKPETYYRLRQVYFTFVDLARTPDRILSNELRNLDRDVISSALCNTSIEFKRYVLAALPSKLRAGIISELKTVEPDINQDTVEMARRRIIQAMRDVIREGRFSMSELTEVKQG
ncbi:MAG: flagellar motor switch protein FliG [Thalassolituus sp.]|jgi:flagellar motor switch protein FliG|tara:strand:- start:8111 stop:10027 length:1917 start_codon:yes stop_codon:yes gene_type:complete